jgi:hypothetical protein
MGKYRLAIVRCDFGYTRDGLNFLGGLMMTRFNFLVALTAFAVSGAAARAGPSITSVGGVSSSDAGVANGRAALSVGTGFNGKLVLNDQPGVYPITISGLGFGSSTGTVTIDGKSVPVLAWSNTAIRVNATGSVFNSDQPWNWGTKTADIVVRTSANQTATKSENFVSACRSRVWGQCTNHCATYRLKNGLQPSATAYGGYTSIGATWDPQRYDQLQWSVSGGKHCGIISAVSVQTSGNIKTYTMVISQRNAAGGNEISSFTTTFQVKGNAVQAYPKFSNNSGGALSYYR